MNMGPDISMVKKNNLTLCSELILKSEVRDMSVFKGRNYPVHDEMCWWLALYILWRWGGGGGVVEWNNTRTHKLN